MGTKQQYLEAKIIGLDAFAVKGTTWNTIPVHLSFQFSFPSFINFFWVFFFPFFGEWGCHLWGFDYLNVKAGKSTKALRN